MKFAAMLVAALAAFPAAAQIPSATRAPSAPPETIAVTGIGKAVVTPDRVTFTAGVHTVAKSVEEAINQNNQRVAQVLAALKAAGAREREIQTSGFSIYPQQDHSPGAQPRIVGYQVTNNVTARTDKVADAGRLLQAAVNAGANTASGLQFELSDQSKGRDEALKSAYADARAKGAVLAQAAGRTLGRTVSIAEISRDAPPPIPYARSMAMREAAASEVPVASGTQEIVHTISAVFELR